MSKSLGNSPDPIDLIDEFGADALRFTLLLLTPHGNDILFGKKKIEVGRDFANKLWNAGRFILFNLRDGVPAAEMPTAPLAPEDRWILSRLSAVVADTDRLLAEYRFTDVAHLLYDFTWKEFCAWYLEIAKTRIQKGTPEEGDRARTVLLHVYRRILALLHPLMPFITEEIWEHLPGKTQDLILGPWPEAEAARRDEVAERQMGFFTAAVTAIRNLRSEMNVPPAKLVPVGVRAAGDEAAVLRELEGPLTALARVDPLTIDAHYAKPHHAAAAVAGGAEIFVLLEGVIDLEVERTRLGRDLSRVLATQEGTQRRLANRDFLERAKPEVVERETQKLQELGETRAKIERALAALED
jgi:valyl-tRNA synthetase